LDTIKYVTNRSWSLYSYRKVLSNNIILSENVLYKVIIFCYLIKTILHWYFLEHNLNATTLKHLAFYFNKESSMNIVRCHFYSLYHINPIFVCHGKSCHVMLLDFRLDSWSYHPTLCSLDTDNVVKEATWEERAWHHILLFVIYVRGTLQWSCYIRVNNVKQRRSGWHRSLHVL
jgi:hypothetical protein